MRLLRLLYTVPLRVRSLFRRDQVEQDLEDEFRDHLERQVEAGLRAARELNARVMHVRTDEGVSGALGAGGAHDVSVGLQNERVQAILLVESGLRE